MHKIYGSKATRLAPMAYLISLRHGKINRPKMQACLVKLRRAVGSTKVVYWRFCSRFARERGKAGWAAPISLSLTVCFAVIL